jgi:4-amino-4-deoxy-L-arabinose transferase-like glycosyltransferase
MKSVQSRRAWPTLWTAWAASILGVFLWHADAQIGGAWTSLRTLVTGVLTFYLAALLGYRVLRRRVPHQRALERTVMELGVGLALLTAWLFLAGVLGLYESWFAWSTLGVLALAPHREFVGDLRARFERKRGATLDRAAFVALLWVAVPTFLLCLAPSTAQDALVYHLAIPARYIAAGGLCYIPESFFAQFPQNVDLLFTFALLLDGETLAQLFHWFLAVAATGAVASLSRTLYPRAEGWIAAACFATIPTAALISSWAYVDLGVVFFILLSTNSVIHWWRRGRRVDFVLAAVLAGVAAGAKYTAGLQGLLFVGAILGRGCVRREDLRSTLQRAGVAAALVALAAGPWWLKNAYYTGNPLFPFGYSLLGGANWDTERSEVLSLALSQWGGSRGWLETLLLPWRLTMSGEFFSIEHHDGVIGCVFLAAAPLLVAAFWVSSRHRLIGCFFLLECLVWVGMTRQIRFLLPALALASALLGATLPLLLDGRGRRLARGVVHAALAVNCLVISIYFASHNPLPVALGLEARERYLARELPGGDFAVFDFIERELPQESYILFGSLGNPGYLCKRPYLADAFFENHTLRELLRQATDPRELLGSFQRRGFTHFLFRWENCFDPTGKRSDISADDQAKLAQFLNENGRRLIEQHGTQLYEIGSGIGPLGRKG